MISSLFTDNIEAAYANKMLWSPLGTLLVFATENYLCTTTKIYSVLTVLVVGIALYSVIEILQKREKAKEAEKTIEMKEKFWFI